VKISELIRSLVPYEPGKPIEETKREYGLDKIVKLASNENPLGVSPKVEAAILGSINNLHRYPDPSSYELAKVIASKHTDLNIEAGNLLFANGSNEAIDLLVRVYCEPGDKILTSEKAFIAYKICAQAARALTTEVKMAEGFRIDLKKIQEAWTPEHKIIFLPNPNNPTGTYFPRQEWEDFLAHFGNRDDVLIVLDEAYTEFVRAKDYPNGMEYITQTSNLMLSRTLSKVYGLAGLRLGYLVGNKEYISYLQRIRNPFNVNALAQAGAKAAFLDDEYIQKSQKIVWEGLDYFYKELSKMGIRYFESQANFVMFEVPGGRAQELNTYLLTKGIILRPLAGYGMSEYLRMSVGLEEENQMAIHFINEWLKSR